MKVTGTLTGITRSGAEFAAATTSEIVFERRCSGKHSFVPVSGTIEPTTADVTSVID